MRELRVSEQERVIAEVHAARLRPGLLIRHEGSVYRILMAQAGSDGVVGVKLRAHNGDFVRDCRFSPDTPIEVVASARERVRFERLETAYFLFSNLKTGEEVRVSAREIGPTAEFLAPGMTVWIETVDGRFSALLFPDLIEVEVAITEDPLHEPWDSAREKPATLANGFRVMVPLHVRTGDRIFLHFSTMRYFDPGLACAGRSEPADAIKERPDA